MSNLCNAIQHNHLPIYAGDRLAASKGFGSSSKTKSKRKRTGPALQEGNPEWVPVAMVSEFKDGKDTLPKILRDNSAIVLYQVGSEIYCSDANSTAFKFPLIDANIIERDGGPAVEVPLDGTVYDLESGKVLEWCPRNNPVRFLLGALKEKSQPKDLRVYPARVNGEGKIFVKFAPE
ncbi:hypothetical protein WJX75_003085 [Coccomyxa subellipsoidea]|uniref:Rieske-like [2Fe-2S] domain-containing protein n=1 Tax=Coccomyxa subellipsoidea TaxID=248742 RepID=A0ABR2YVP0_9CHLO